MAQQRTFETQPKTDGDQGADLASSAQIDEGPRHNWTHVREVMLRSLALLLWIGWQGGFFFYAAVVVPIGGAELGSELEQGLITRRVTVWLNLIGLLAISSWWVALWATSWSASARLRWLMTGGVGLVAAGLIGLFVLHGSLDAQIELETRSVIDHEEFYEGHRVYLVISAIQWLVTFAILPLTLWGWQRR